MNAGAQRSSKAQHSRRHTYCTNATSSPDEPLLSWQTCNGLASTMGVTLAQSTSINLRLRSMHRQALADHLWKRWWKEYLLVLRSANKATPKLRPRLQVGDVVLVRDDDSQPILSKLTRVTELLPGRDGIARARCLKLVSGTVIRHRSSGLPQAFKDSLNTERQLCASSDFSTHEIAELEAYTSKKLSGEGPKPKQKKRSAVAEHCKVSDPRISPDGAIVLERENNHRRRLLLKPWYIQKTPGNINGSSITLPAADAEGPRRVSVGLSKRQKHIQTLLRLTPSHP
ncbi:hypothetical protein HPB49_006284 [Dermacentor silvarum]|uniref:Uncharacterized protein n=1 Tax=Dermacentor silvarum TaxID=543639 RepID=A0ACB8DVU2_DERSI|nr:hypothetical protein HPB49_006284 [Dermacentor silvarum]